MFDNLILKDRLRISDARNASEELVDFVIDNRLLLCSQGRVYLNYGTHYQQCKQEMLTDLLYSVIDVNQISQIPTRAVNEAVKRLLHHPSLFFDMEEERRRTEHLVNIKNCVFNIESGSYSSTRGDAVFDYMLDFSFNPDATIDQARSFIAFVESSLGRVYLLCLLRILGYCVSSLTKARKAFLLLGKGSTGKSTILEFVESVIGEALCAHVPFHRIGNIHSRAEYIGKRINISRDNSDHPMKDEDAFKSLVSCEMLTGRRLYENAVDFVPRLKLIFASNVDLNFAHPDDAVYDRLLVLPFTKEIAPEQRDVDLLQKLLAERDLILSAALKTLPELVKSGYDFQEPDECKQYIACCRAALHSVDGFLEECCQPDEDGSVSSVLLFNRYVEWCAENGVKPDGQKTFYARVRAFNSQIRDSKVYHAGSRVNGFKGIGLKSAAREEEYQK